MFTGELHISIYRPEIMTIQLVEETTLVAPPTSTGGKGLGFRGWKLPQYYRTYQYRYQLS